LSAKLRFLHSGDIHLGRPASSGGELPQHLISLFNRAGIEALKNLFHKAVELDVDFIVIAGDLHDREARSVAFSQEFNQACKSLEEADIPLYLISGNHDPLPEERELFSYPPNVKILSSQEVECISYQDKANILGQSYRSPFESRKMYSFFTAPDNSKINIGLLHTQLDPNNSRYVPVAKEDLLSREDIDYWALGHLHEPQIIHDSSPTIAYAGTPQGRNCKETGLRGAFLVEYSRADQLKTPELSFIPTSPLIFRQININLSETATSDLGNISDLKRLLEEKADTLLSQSGFSDENLVNTIEQNSFFSLSKEARQDFSREFFAGLVIRWVITGENPLQDMIADNQEELRRELKQSLNKIFASPGQTPFLWTHSIKFNTIAELPELSDLGDNNPLFARVQEIFQELEEDTELTKELLDQWGEIWQGAEEPEERDFNKFYADQAVKEEILAAARREILSQLFRGD